MQINVTQTEGKKDFKIYIIYVIYLYYIFLINIIHRNLHYQIILLIIYALYELKLSRILMY